MQPFSQKITLNISKQPVDYQQAQDFMQNHVSKMIAGQAQDMVWLLEHPPIYTAGTSAKAEDLLVKNRFPTFSTNRGGQFTYHGPGQRIIYVMLNLNQQQDIRAFVKRLEQWVINVLAEFDIEAQTLEGKVGIWVARADGRGFDKISALGIRLKKWISFHGLSINVNPNLEHFSGIVPCGINQQDYGVTSLEKLGKPCEMQDIDAKLIAHFPSLFNATLIYQDS